MTDLVCPHSSPFVEWSDWTGVDSDAVVTFQTMKHQLWETWNNQCVRYVHSDCDHGDDIDEQVNCDTAERVVDHARFDTSDLLPPGVHQPSPDEFDVVVPQASLSANLCEQWISQLNEEYDRDFTLVYEA